MRKHKEACQGALYLLPSFVLILVYAIIPIFMNMYFSFTKFNIMQPAQWVGFANYKRMFSDPYPAPNGEVYSSIRNEVQMEALADMRALALLEELSDRNFVEQLIHEGLDYRLTFTHYPSGADYLFRLRRRVNLEIAKRVHS